MKSLWYRVLSTGYGEEGGRLRFGVIVVQSGGIMYKVSEGVGLLNVVWLLDNVDREVGDDSSTLFSNNPQLDGSLTN